MTRNAHVAKLPYSPEMLGHVRIEADPTTVAGSMATAHIVYTAGKFGIDDQGSVRFLLRFASDAGRPQFDRPGAPNYCTATASNGTKLLVEYHPRGAFRPWFKAIRVNVMREALREGDTITLVLGDRSQGGAGWRTSTMREARFEVRVQVDPFGTVVYGDVAGEALLDLVPGRAHEWKAVLPTFRGVGETFSLRIRADDACGNPVHRLVGPVTLHADGPVAGLPAGVESDGATIIVPGLVATATGTLRITLRDASGETLAESNPLVIADHPRRSTWWGDFHAQSEETIGTNSAREYFEYARDKAFCDFVGHQGNDFQITNAFYAELNALYREFNAPGAFVTIPGYEYSPVTHLGGDRNIFFFDDGRPIRRSSHALVEDLSDIDTDCNHVLDLFAALKRDGERVFAFAHVGGRYADLHAGHDVAIERSVEIHSAWGTFEWLLFDAFELGHRVGVVCNSDDHKGRPGASHPGASIFGAYGGLTCLYLDDLSRESIWECMQRRRHYGTTGDRLHLQVRAEFSQRARRYAVDPILDPSSEPEYVDAATMGDIVSVEHGTPHLRVSLETASAIERIDLRAGPQTLEVIRPYDAQQLGRRIRVIWEGAEYRGRGRMTTWDGSLTIAGNDIESFSPVNFWHLDKQLARTAPGTLTWESVTTGNYAGAEIVLGNVAGGTLHIDTPHLETSLAIDSIGFEDTVFEAGGLGRRVRVFRLPDVNPHRGFALRRHPGLRARHARERPPGLVQPDLPVPPSLTARVMQEEPT